MKIAKEYRWEMGHRLPFHEGKCKNLHGHSYKCMVEINGEPDKNGMVLDYYDMKKIIKPIIEELDHSFMVWSGDKEVIEFLDKINSKKVIVDFQSTAENICLYLLERIKKTDLPKNINTLKVKVFETENTYAEEEISLK
ncbi:6-pyruvoyl trahydropterin synthase family protein [Stygiobacter electus]|jgi:6-pyruvoyltetrahydropterin/6-carboxytetrahydropterin synthase|uniref:6-carboxy-5,6,7,8-tetrahydropterin synthase n=1 Tax=Stygiobacter electus TaxID=3032292 RepID=A0AAE3P1M4_9BACT|nr:6-carboxytetrahydropterin synthase [Stygiobacter electus]MDF1612732.1 6-carboxytetrahydropterin synthase [Stygiobacter electus]